MPCVRVHMGTENDGFVSEEAVRLDEKVFFYTNDADYYEVYLQNDKGTTLLNEEVCFDEIGDVIDEYIRIRKKTISSANSS